MHSLAVRASLLDIVAFLLPAYFSYDPGLCVQCGDTGTQEGRETWRKKTPGLPGRLVTQLSTRSRLKLPKKEMGQV